MRFEPGLLIARLALFSTMLLTMMGDMVDMEF